MTPPTTEDYHLHQEGINAASFVHENNVNLVNAEKPARPWYSWIRVPGLVLVVLLVGFLTMEFAATLWLEHHHQSNTRSSVCPATFQDTANDDGSSPCPGTIYNPNFYHTLMPSAGYKDLCNECGYDPETGGYVCTLMGCGECFAGPYTYGVGDVVPHYALDQWLHPQYKNNRDDDNAENYDNYNYNQYQQQPKIAWCNVCTCQAVAKPADGDDYSLQLDDDYYHYNYEIVCTEDTCDDQCWYEGNIYTVGEYFSDGCNSCVCNNDNTVTCSYDNACDGCTWRGELQELGSCFEADYGNYCACMDDQTVVCTDCQNY